MVVKSLPNTAAVDLESVLFLEKGGRALGRVFDVFGPVTRPFYAVRYAVVQGCVSGVTYRYHATSAKIIWVAFSLC